MDQERWKSYVVRVALAEGIGTLASFLTQEGMRFSNTIVVKPPVTPPAIFPIAWETL